MTMHNHQAGHPQDSKASMIARAMLEVRGLRADLTRLHAEATHHRDQAQRASVAAREAMAALTAEQDRSARLEGEVRWLREEVTRVTMADVRIVDGEGVGVPVVGRVGDGTECAGW